MSTFSPYVYNVEKFSRITGLNNSNTDAYYDLYTMLSKPLKRNTYKLSLAQILHYMTDFGIGYNSICEHELSKKQLFMTCMYVNRHNSNSVKRPATIADVKLKLIDVVHAMIRHVVKDSDKSGIKKVDIIYPKYLFTLDTDEYFGQKLERLTDKHYVEVDGFTDFAYAASSGNPWNPSYSKGYVPADSLLMCPKHDHVPHENMKYAVDYNWSIKLSPQGNIAWDQYMAGFNLHTFKNANQDTAVNPCGGPDGAISNIIPIEAEGHASWQYPDNITCYPNPTVYPKNTVNIDGKNMVTIRYPGRRYRLFKRVDD